ncbi:tudor domain-containing protein 7A [Cololabis saira]|uniref:tudor domain-containing protein 7A n=1 Tax=Cololabis saira TaxID=129043 RepID=UPI002AD4D05A|nr:tudor domain-containing protein 7A [Cololabis saira]
MSDETIKKMLRAVLQTSKDGVSIKAIQSMYFSFCGEYIPFKKLGHLKLEDYLRSIPTVVRMEYRMDEIKCFAAVCQDTAHIAELVAKQKNPKKRSQVVNCKMRYRPSNPYMLNVTPRSSLRQPSSFSHFKGNKNPFSHGGCSASGDYRRLDQKLNSSIPVEHRQPAFLPTAENAKQKGIPQRRLDQKLNSSIPVEHRQPAFLPTTENAKEKGIPQRNVVGSVGSTNVYNMEAVQNKITKLLEKYSNGLWMSKISDVYSQMFSQKLHPQALEDMEKWPHICMVEKPSMTNRADRLIYPPLPPKPPAKHLNNTNSSSVSSTLTAPASSHPRHEERSTTGLFGLGRKPEALKKPLANHALTFSPQTDVSSSIKVLTSVTLRSPAPKPALAPKYPQCYTFTANSNGGYKLNLSSAADTRNQSTSPLQPGNGISPLLKDTSPFPTSSALCPPTSAYNVLSTDMRQKIKELLSKNSYGLWAHALPKLFMDTYKIPFPEQVLENLSLLIDICMVEYPIPNNKKKAILYNCREDVNNNDAAGSHLCKRNLLPSGLEVVGHKAPPNLVLPSEQYPSVLVTEAKSSNAVTVRFVGENYSKAQEAMERAMLSYSQRSRQFPLSHPVVGQLVAVRGEEGDDVARGQVMEVMNPSKVKVYYVDHGFTVETSGTNLLKLPEEFFSLPFQATRVKLAGLVAFTSHPLILSYLEKVAVGNILLMEVLEPRQPNEAPLVVFYDTSKDEDVNINSTCLKALQDKSMNNPLSVNVTCQDVCVSNVCADGTIYCQLPSRGTTRLRKLLEEVDAYFISQNTSDCLVCRPFSGMFCLARYKGNWARAEITNMHGKTVMEILFMDFGVQITTEITELREVPPVFLKVFTIIPPQAIKCRLADVTVSDGDWSHETVLWVKKLVLEAGNCKMKILEVEEVKGDKVVYMYLYIGDGDELHKSINHQLAQKLMGQSSNTICDTVGNLVDKVNRLALSTPFLNPKLKTPSEPNHRAEEDTISKTEIQPLPLPPPLELPQVGQNTDVFVQVAHHPGYFVVQLWQDLHKLEVLMGEMVLYYNQTVKTNTSIGIQKGDICAAKIDKNWHRVQVKGILTRGLVSVYELDYGKHELVSTTLIQPLLEEFRQLPFQAVVAQLAGFTEQQWSEEACMLFRNYVEKRALVAQVEDVYNVKGNLWEHKLTVFLVDTTLEDKDLWIHSIMADISEKLS